MRDPRAYLVRIVTRQALNRLRSVSRRREEYVGEWLPEPLLTSPDVAEDVEFAENVSIAMLTVLETLGPAERAVFVLREVFETPYDEIAEVGGQDPGRGPADRAPGPRARRGPAAADAGGPGRAAGGRREVHGRRLHRRRAGPDGGARPGRGDDRRRRRRGGGGPEADHRGREGGWRSWPARRRSRTSRRPRAWFNGMPGVRIDVDGAPPR